MKVLRTGGMALLSVGMCLGLLDGPAQAQTRNIRLSGLDEVPVVITGATGELRVRIPNDGQTIQYTLSYEGIEGGDVLQAHIHLGQFGVNGGIDT